MSSSPESAVVVASAEFTLKSSPVRRTLEQRLVDDLKTALTRAGFHGFRVEKHAARIVIRRLRNPEFAAKCCARVFGVAYAAPTHLLPASMEGVTQTIVESAREALRPGQSFAIRSHRSAPSPLSRREIEIRGGSEILRALKDKAVKVDLKQPDVTIYVDLADDRAYIYRDRLQGPGGLPLSSQWRMLAVLDSGPLTILAGYAMMRRGCLVELFIPLSETIPNFAKDYQLNLARKLRELVTRTNYRAFTIEFEELLGGEFLSHPLGYAGSKRLARMAGMRFAKEKRFKGVIFPDVAGDITAIQLERAGSIGGLPVFRPLIGLEMQDLVEMCRQTEIPEEDLFSQVNLQAYESKGLDASLHLPKALSEVTIQQISL